VLNLLLPTVLYHIPLVHTTWCTVSNLYEVLVFNPEPYFSATAGVSAEQTTIQDVKGSEGIGRGFSPEAVAADRVAGGGKGGQGANLSEEERAARRAT